MPRAEVTSFVGRRIELAEARRLLNAGRLLTVTGPGGSGKSRLATRLVAQIGPTCTVRPHVVELADLRRPDELMTAIEAALGTASPVGSIAALSGGDQLLVLDDCDQLVDACADVVSELLAATITLRILVTSRQRLGLPAESVLHLSGLPVPQDDAAIGAIALFVDRATAVRPDFVVDDRNRATLGRICRQLDGLPLAVELAAQWSRSLPLSGLADRLDRDLSLLAKGKRTAPSRQRSLCRTIELSHDLCTPSERLLWQRLSVFAGGFDLASAVTVCADGQLAAGAVRRLVERLADKSVLVADQRAHGTRYRMLNTMMLYAREKLGTTGEARARHRNLFLTMIERHTRTWFGSGQLTDTNALTGEHANLLAAIDADPRDDRTVQAVVDLQYYWRATGHLVDGAKRMREIVDGPGGRAAETLRAAARLHLWLGDVRTGFVLADRAVAAADRADLGGALAVRAQAAIATGDIDRARLDFAEAVSLLRHAEPASCELVLAYAGWSLAEARSGEHEPASTLARKAIEIADGSGEKWARSIALYCHGVVLWLSGDLDGADWLASECLRLQQKFRDTLTQAFAVELLAWTATARADHRRAATLFGAAHRLARTATGAAAVITQGDHRNCVDTARRALGDVAYRAAFDEGAGIGAISATGRCLGAPLTVVPAQSSRAMLTRRECEVAELAALGLTNKEIAGRLVISPRTAETHVNRVLAKLGFTSRAQLPAWVDAAGATR